MPPPAEGLASRLFLGPALRTQPDRRLVTLVREGYETAFEEIVRRYGRPLGRYAASIVGGRSEDVLQEAFAKALPALQRDDAEIDLRPWLFRIVRNTALNDLRDSPPTPELLAEALAGARDPAEELERREELADLMRRLRALPEPQRAAIVMRELEGLGHEEIAEALGLTGGGARQAIYRARQALRDGAGLLLPLPLLRLLIDHGGEAAGMGAGGAIAAAGTSAGGVGAGGALKLGAVAVVVAGSVGAGVAVQSHREKDAAAARPIPAVSSAPSSRIRPAAQRLVDASALSAAAVGGDRSGHGSGSGADDGSHRGSGGEGLGDHRESSGEGPGPSSPESHGLHHGHGRGGERHHGGPREDNAGHHGGGEGRSGRGGNPEESAHRGGHGGSGHGGGGGEAPSSDGSGHGGTGTDGGRGRGGGPGSDGTTEVVPPPPPPEEPSHGGRGSGDGGEALGP